MTSGYELEFLGANIKDLGQIYQIPLTKKDDLVSYKTFNLKPEPGITTNFLGGELISPIYSNRSKELIELKEKLIILKENKAFIPLNSTDVGFHIHMGRQFLKQNNSYYRIFFKLLFAFQEEIKEMARGEHEALRANIFFNAAPLELNEVKLLLNDLRAIRLLSGKGKCLRFTNQFTVEFRYFNSSLNYEVLRRYLNFTWQLCSYVENGVWDEEIINYYYEHFDVLGLNPKKERKEVLQRLLNN